MTLHRPTAGLRFLQSLRAVVFYCDRPPDAEMWVNRKMCHADLRIHRGHCPPSFTTV